MCALSDIDEWDGPPTYEFSPPRFEAWRNGEAIWTDALSQDQLEQLAELSSQFPLSDVAEGAADTVAFHITEAAWGFARLLAEAADLHKAAGKKAGAAHMDEVARVSQSLVALLEDKSFLNENQLYLSSCYPLAEVSPLSERLHRLIDTEALPIKNAFEHPFNLPVLLSRVKELGELAEESAALMRDSKRRTPDAIQRAFVHEMFWFWRTLSNDNGRQKRDARRAERWPFLEFTRRVGRVVDPDFNGKAAAEWMYKNLLAGEQRVAADFEWNPRT